MQQQSEQPQGPQGLGYTYFECVLAGALRQRGRQVCIGKRIEFERSGEGAWLLDLTPPKAKIARVDPDKGAADMKLLLDLNDEEFCDFIDGKLDFRAAYAAQKVVVIGNVALMRRLASLMAMAPKVARRNKTNPLEPRRAAGVRLGGSHK